MQFHNVALLLGLLGISIPIIIHLLNRRTRRVIEWGAIDFLFESLTIRNRRIQMEEALLMVSRCLLVGLLVIALAQPFIPPGSTVPWGLVLPLAFAGIIALGVAAVLHSAGLWRKGLFAFGAACLLAVAVLIIFEKQLNLSRFGSGGRQDIALVIDGSTSMLAQQEGVSNFERAVSEAREILRRAPRTHAFSLILGGPTPSAKILMPTSDRSAVEAALDELRPVDGAMAAYDCLTLASLSLAQGDNSGKQIILISDAQNVGWEQDQPSRWEFLKEAFSNLPSEPHIVLRALPLPTHVRNATVSDISFNRDIVGVDRRVAIDVTIENTGNEAITPEAVKLRVSSQVLGEDTIGQIRPGATETVRFYHRFLSPGAQYVSARVLVEDDIPQDDERISALNVASSLKVLIVDGRPTGKFLERASSFASLALAPALQEELDYYQQSGIQNPDFRFLVEPTAVPVTEVATGYAFENFDVVILADVPRLPELTAGDLATFVEAGGGLLIAPGAKAQPDFYNAWKAANGTPLVPAKLEEMKIMSGEAAAPFSPSLRSFRHPAVRRVGDSGRSDFGSVRLSGYWKLEQRENAGPGATVAGSLNTGDPFLVSGQSGAGRVLLLPTSLDTQASNLPTRQSFLPFVHELVYFLANPADYSLDLKPSWEISLLLSDSSQVVQGQGLRGDYYATHSTQKPLLSRIDPGVSFHWWNRPPATGIPADGFKVQWTGRLRPPMEGNYRLEADVEGGRLEVWIDDKSVFVQKSGDKPADRKVKLEESKWHDFRAEYLADEGAATAVLYWSEKDVPRQTIPVEQFSSLPENKQGAGGSLEEDLTVRGPDGRPRVAHLSTGKEGTLATLEGDVSAGLYQINIPKEQRLYFNSILAQGESEIPFTVRRDPAESRLTPLNPDELALLNKYVTVAEPESAEAVLEFLSGREFGADIWKYIAAAAFVFILLEIALARWIARMRRSGEEITVDFQPAESPTNRFRAQLERVRKTANVR